MNLTHRPFQTDDAATICAFPQSVEELFFMFPKADYPLTPVQLIAASRERHDPTVALLSGRIAGYANFFETRERNFCTIGNLVVDPSLRRQGVGRYLVGIMAQKAFDDHGARFVRASCFSHNRAAYGLYHKMGFRPADMGQRLGPDGEPLLLVHLHLQARDWIRR